MAATTGSLRCVASHLECSWPSQVPKPTTTAWRGPNANLLTFHTVCSNLRLQSSPHMRWSYAAFASTCGFEDTLALTLSGCQLACRSFSEFKSRQSVVLLAVTIGAAELRRARQIKREGGSQRARWNWIPRTYRCYVVRTMTTTTVMKEVDLSRLQRPTGGKAGMGGDTTVKVSYNVKAFTDLHPDLAK